MSILKTHVKADDIKIYICGRSGDKPQLCLVFIGLKALLPQVFYLVRQKLWGKIIGGSHI